MLANLPTTIDEVHDWTWDNYQPLVDELKAHELSEATLDTWMKGWTRLNDLISEVYSRARLATTQDTTDEAATNYYKHLLDNISPPFQKSMNELQRKLVESGLTPENFEIPLEKMQADIDLFREENVPLSTQEQVLGMDYAKVTGAQVVEWDGEEMTLPQLSRVQEETDRARREAAWKLTMERWLQDRDAINNIWTQLFELRQKMAKNAGFDNYRDFRWKQFKRFDYTPADAETFQNAIEQVVVPAASRLAEKRRQKLGIDTVRPWDVTVDPNGGDPISPWETIEDFSATAEHIFKQVDPTLGEYYATMRREGLYDLPNRKNKGPGAYCTRFALAQRPFVFMNAVGSRRDVRTLLHEFGHAFHGFESMELPYAQQRAYPIEFAEVASMAMELLAIPYLDKEHGGYFGEAEQTRHINQHVEKIINFWPYMAVVDAFQHWAYSGSDEAADPANCDAKWAELWDRFMPDADYSGFEDVKMTGWHRKQHIYRYPFYYIEYGLAQLGAVQVWANALKNQEEAVAAYRSGLALGGTRNLHELFGTAGAKFAFDAGTLGEAVDLLESKLAETETA